jgi:hypothetical protein
MEGFAFENNYFYELPQDIQDKITDIKKEQDEKTIKRLEDKLHYLKNCDDYSDDLTDEMFEMMDVPTILSYVASDYIIYDYDYYPNCYSKDFIVDKLNEAYGDGGSLFNNKEKVIDMVFTYFTEEEVVFIIQNKLSY